MKLSQLFGKTKREVAREVASTNHRLLVKGGFIVQLTSGIYTYLPLGLKVLTKIENIVREEMDAIGGEEVLMPALQPKSLWQETKRWDGPISEIMYKVKDREGKELGLGPTHEEVLTDIIRKDVRSYKDLPLYVYQIQTKFRDEPRAKSGLLRGREFRMKDLYSFHTNEKDFKKYYEIVKKAYLKTFKRCGLSDVLVVEASGGAFTKDLTHEFHVTTPAGEDSIIYCEKCGFAQNVEIAKKKEGESCPKCKKTLKVFRTIEIGHIFTLGTKYSKDMKAYFSDKDGKEKPIIMGCYGLGVSRLLGAIVEVKYDENGIIWPKNITPYQIHLLNLELKTKKETEKIYKDLQNQGIEVLWDDRDESPGVKFADADLIGIPIRIIVSPKTLKASSVEISPRDSEKVKLVKINRITQYIKT